MRALPPGASFGTREMCGGDGSPAPPCGGYHARVFTGLVRAVGVVRSAERSAAGLRLVVALGPLAPDGRAGDSVAVAGACLTLVADPVGGDGAFDVVPETLARTTLGGLAPGARVNLEPSLRAGDPLGGHIVQGHVDGTGTVRDLRRGEGGTLLDVDAPDVVTDGLIEKGSVTVDGVSLTVVAVSPGRFRVALVPHTLAVTTLGALRPGDAVNLEADYVGRWVRRLVAAAGVRTC